MQTDSKSPVAPATHGLLRPSGTWIGPCATVSVVVVWMLAMIWVLLMVMFWGDKSVHKTPTMAERAAVTLEGLHKTPAERAAATLEGLQQTWTKKAADAAQQRHAALQRAGAVFTKKLVPNGTPPAPAPTGFAHLSFGMPTNGLTDTVPDLKEIKWIENVYDRQTGILQEFELRYHGLALPATDFYATLIKCFGVPSEIGELVPSALSVEQEVRWRWPEEDVEVILVVQTILVADALPGRFYPRVTFAKGRHARALAAAQVQTAEAQADAAERAALLARFKDNAQ